jgi:outer membrane protein TolC
MLRRALLFVALLTAAPALAADEPKAEEDEGFGTYKPPVATIKPRAYSLAEILAFADRNHPAVWAARARLSAVRAQLDEAKWAPFFQWGANVTTGVLPALGGTLLYGSPPVTQRTQAQFSTVEPFFQFGLSGAIPLYTFGKITSIRDAAEAGVRVSEWDVEKFRQQVRMDCRRAYFGIQMARDAKYVIDEAISRLDKGIDGIKKKLEAHDKSVAEWDRFRLEVFREEVVARTGEIVKAELHAMAALRFLTGIQTAFEIPDEPLKRPDRPLAPIASYLQAARLFRPEINMARAGVIARSHMVDHQRAKLFPDIGLGLGANFGNAPSAIPMTTAWIADPFNYFGYAALIGVRWNLDLLPQQARIAHAEAQLEETRALERLALGGTMVEVEQAYGSVLEAKIKEEAWNRAEHKAKTWISTIQDNIDLGTLTENHLLEPLRAYGFARVNHLYALMDLNVNMSQLAWVSGWDSAAPTGQ